MPGQGSNFWVTSFPAAMPGGTAYGAGGGYAGADILTARDPLDAKRMAAGFAPGASYPDGYLGNITDRQEDKVLGALSPRLKNPTSYQRGVHRGEVQPRDAYFWEPEINPDAGLVRQSNVSVQDVEGGIVMMTPKFAPTGDPVVMLAHDGKTAGMTDREQEAALRARGGDPAMNPVQVISPSRRARMAQHLPRWSGVWQA